MTPQTFIARCEGAGFRLYRNPDDTIKLRAVTSGTPIPPAVKKNVAKYKVALLPLLQPSPPKPPSPPALSTPVAASPPETEGNAEEGIDARMGAAADTAIHAVWVEAMQMLFADAKAQRLPVNACYPLAPGTMVDNLNRYVTQTLCGLHELRDIRDWLNAKTDEVGGDGDPLVDNTTLRLFERRMERARIEWADLENMAFWWGHEKKRLTQVSQEKGEK